MKSLITGCLFVVVSTLLGCNRSQGVLTSPNSRKILSDDQIAHVQLAIKKIAHHSQHQSLVAPKDSPKKGVFEQVVKGSTFDTKSYEAAKKAFEKYQATPFAPKPRLVTCSTINDPPPSFPQLESRDFYTQPSLAVVQAARGLGTPQAMNDFVRYQIANEVLFGATRSAAKTLAVRSGTVADKANLLVAMLRSEEIPSYFLVGEVYLKESVVKRLLGVADTTSIFTTMINLTGAYFANPSGYTAQFYTFINGEPYWTFPHIWVRAYFDGAWQNLDPTQPGDIFSSLQQSALYSNASTLDWNSFWDKWFFQADQDGNYIKPTGVTDYFVKTFTPTPYFPTNINVASSVLDEQRIDGVLSNLTPCSTGQAFGMQGSPYEYTATFSLLNSDASQSIFTFKAPLAEMSEGLTYLSHSAGLLADVGNSQSGNLEFRVNDVVAESIPTTTGTQYQLSGTITSPPYWSEAPSRTVKFAKPYIAGDVFHFNVFAGQIGSQTVSSSINDILQSVNTSQNSGELDGTQCNPSGSSPNPCDRFIMARLMRATGMLAEHKAELANRDISKLFGMTWVPGGISGTFVSGTGITTGQTEADKEFGLSPASGFMDTESAGLISLPTVNDVFLENYLNTWLMANNMQMVAVDQAEATVWEELYGIPGLSVSRVLQWAKNAIAIHYQGWNTNYITPIEHYPLSADNSSLFSQFNGASTGEPSYGETHEGAINSYGVGGQFWGLSLDVAYNCAVPQPPWSCTMLGGWIVFPPPGESAPVNGGAVYSTSSVYYPFAGKGHDRTPGAAVLVDNDKSSKAGVNGNDNGQSPPSPSFWNKLKKFVSSEANHFANKLKSGASSGGPNHLADSGTDGGGVGAEASPTEGTDIQNGSPVNGVPSGSSTPGNVNITTGLMWQTFKDFYLRGRTPNTPLKFVRTYYTLSQFQDPSGWVGTGDFGPGWISNYDMRILDGSRDSNGKLTMGSLQACPSTNDIVLIPEEGNPIVFTYQASTPTVYGSPATFPAANLVVSGSTYVLTLPHNIVYTFKNDCASNYNGRLLSIKEPHGELVQFAYDSNGRLLTVSTNLAGTLTFSRNASNQVSSITASNGNLVYTYKYDSNSRLISSTDFDGHTTKYEYNFSQPAKANLLTSITDPIGRIKSFSYYQNGKVFQETGHGGAVFSFQYAPYSYDMYSQVTYPNGSTVEYHYDSHFRITQIEYPDGGRAFQTWNDAGRISNQTDQLGRPIDYKYDNRGNRTGVSKLLDGSNYRGMTWDQTFDIPTAITPLAGSPTNFTLDQNTGDALNISRSSGSGSTLSSIYTYDQFGMPLSTNNGYNSYSNLTNSNGETVFVYDNRNPQTLSYDARRRVTQTQYANGRTIRYLYDNYDRVILIEDTNAPTIVNKYDAVGRKYETDRIAGGVTQVATFEYDDRDRVIASTNFNGERTEYKYDVVGVDVVRDAPTEVIAPDGKVTRFVYDFAGRVVRKILPGGAQISYEYDVAGQLIAVIDPRGLVTQFEYDANGRLSRSLSQSATSKVQSNGTQISSGFEQTLYSYDAADRLIMKQQLLANEDNVAGAYVTQYAYDGADRLVTKTITHTRNGKVVQTFDAINYSYLNILDQSLLTSVSNTYETLTFSYQTQAPFSMVGFSVTPTAAGTALGLQASNFRVIPSMNGPAAQVEQNGSILVKNGYDAAGRLISAMGALGSTSFSATLGYDAFGRLATLTDSNGLVGTYGYDNADRIQSIGWSGAGLSMSESLTRNPAGLITQDAREIGTFRYGYTSDNQVNSTSYTGSQGISGPWVNGTFTYDSSGNMLSNATDSFSVNNNFVTSYNGTTYWPDYSGLGRVMGTTQGSNATSFVFNPDGQLLQLSLFSGGSPSTSANYYYDGLGRRIAKVKTFSSDSTSKITYTHYGLEDRILLAQVSKSSSTNQTLFVDGKGSDQHLFEINSANGALGFMTDHLGSVINSPAAGGMSVYGLYGENLGTSMPTNSGTEALAYGFAGREYDPESGYYYLRARYYDPNTARFLTKDPLGVSADTNPYRYAMNNSLNVVDPYGLFGFFGTSGGAAGLSNGPQATNGSVIEGSSGFIFGSQNGQFGIGGVMSMGSGSHIAGGTAGVGLTFGAFFGDISSLGGSGTAVTTVRGPFSWTDMYNSSGDRVGFSIGFDGYGSGWADFTTDTNTTTNTFNFGSDGITTTSTSLFGGTTSTAGTTSNGGGQPNGSWWGDFSSGGFGFGLGFLFGF